MLLEGMNGSRRAARACALAIAAACAPVLPGPVHARGDGSFQGPVHIPAPPRPVWIAAGDFNRDGALDLAAILGETRVQVFLQEGYHWEPGHAHLGLKAPAHLRAADLDGDGDDDLVVSDPGSHAVTVLRCAGDGGFAPPVLLRGGYSVLWTAAGDLDGDGLIDLVAANWSTRSLIIFLGRADGTFDLHRRVAIDDPPFAVEALDFDGDGLLDLAAGSERLGVVPLRNQGGASFIPGPPLPFEYGCATVLDTGDFNQDGALDLATRCGVGLGQRGGEPQLLAFFRPEGLPAIGDYDGDGHQDFMVLQRSRLHVRLGRGDGTFFSPLPAVVGVPAVYVTALLVADLDRNGRDELVAGSQDPAGITVFWDGIINRVLHLPGPARDCEVADVDHDGALDLVVPQRLEPEVRLYRFRGLAPRDESIVIATDRPLDFVEVVDLDGDRIADLAGTQIELGTASISFLEPAWTVRHTATFPVGVSPRDLRVARLDGDRLPDLVIPCSGSDHLAVILGPGVGAAPEPRTVPSLREVRVALAGDLDGDGLDDVIAIARDEVAAHFNRSGELQAAVSLEKRPDSVFLSGAIADLDGDGLPDVLVADNLHQPGVLYLRNAGGGRIHPAVPLAGTPPSGTLAAADLDGDGRLDLGLFTASPNSLVVALQEERLRFTLRSYPGRSGLSLRIADLDRDGALDAIVQSGAQVSILPGLPARAPLPTFRRGDANGDGSVEVSDAITVLARLFLAGDPPPCEDAADANDDGTLDAADPVAALSYLFLGGPALPAPGAAACGADRTADALPACAGACP